MTPGPRKIFYGWWIVGAVFIISAYVSGVVSFGFTAVMEPMARELQWSYASLSLAGSIRGLEIGLLAPRLGALLDRLGPRKLILTGGLITGAGLILLSRITSLPLFYGAYMAIAVGLSTCIGVVPITVVGYWFRRRISLVTGIVVSGVAMGGLMVPIVARIVDTFGWRTAMAIFGLGTWCVILPLGLIVRHRPEAMGMSPDGDPAHPTLQGDALAGIRTVGGEATVRQAITSRFFWHVEISFICHVFAVHAVITHVMPYLGSIGISRLSSSLVASTIPIISILGRLSFGWFGDRWQKSKVTATGIVLIVISLLIFGFIDHLGTWSIVLFVLLFSIGYGGPVPMMPNLLRERFGRAHLGAIIGISQGVAMAGSITGQPLAGWIFDASGSYQGAWLAFAAANILGLISMLTVPRRDVGTL